MGQTTLQEKIKKQEETIARAQKSIADLKKKSEARQKVNLLKAADKAGFYSIEISEKDLDEAMKKIVESANSPQSSTPKNENTLEEA